MQVKGVIRSGSFPNSTDYLTADCLREFAQKRNLPVRELEGGHVEVQIDVELLAGAPIYNALCVSISPRPPTLEELVQMRLDAIISQHLKALQEAQLGKHVHLNIKEAFDICHQTHKRLLKLKTAQEGSDGG
jgi:hypothetical protein